MGASSYINGVAKRHGEVSRGMFPVKTFTQLTVCMQLAGLVSQCKIFTIKFALNGKRIITTLGMLLNLMLKNSASHRI